MIHEKLLKPQSIVVVGGSDDIQKPGGKVLKNLRDHNFGGPIYVVNPKADTVQGMPAHRDVAQLPQVDCAILAVAAKFCPAAVETLAREKGTRGFIILSAGFHEENEEGARLERQIVDTINSVGGSLIGPNCIGMMNTHFKGVFSTPIPRFDPKGIDFISGSGATALFIIDSGITKGLTFNSVYSVGNSAQLGVEDVLEHMDESFDPATSSLYKLLYIESVSNPQKMLKHARSLIRKGCKIAAIKAGSSSAGSRAASSHTGALASSDKAVDALFRKAGIVRCYGRDELTTTMSVLMHPELKGRNIAIVTHAGGPAVMLTDALSDGGLEIPRIEGPKADELLAKLFPGSSVANPIDFLATGTAEHLGLIIDACERDFDNIDAMVVIFGSPGLFPIFDVYDVLHEKMRQCRKPIFPVLPSTICVKEEVDAFVAKGRIVFPDEVTFGRALARVCATPRPAEPEHAPAVDLAAIRAVVDAAPNGYLAPDKVQALLDAAGIPRAGEAVVTTADDAAAQAARLGYPVVMKVVGPVHKSDVGGVALGVKDDAEARAQFERMIKIPDTTAILIQPMLSGTELFVGAKREEKFGHMVLCGMGGIFIEVLKDVQTELAPVTRPEALAMIGRLRSHRMFQGVRGQEPISEERFADIVTRVSALCQAAPEIFEMDLNPLLGRGEKIIAVDARMRIEK